MTHTLHRLGSRDDFTRDYIVFSIASFNVNHVDAGPKLRANFTLLQTCDPVNCGDDTTGGVYTGPTPEDIIDRVGDKSCVTGVFTSRADLRTALQRLKEADNGVSVVVSGNFDDVFAVSREVGLQPHTVHLSLGVHGRTDRLPEAAILEITTMCGHGMVCPDHVRRVVDDVLAGRQTMEEAGKELARPCTCAMFNPERAAQIVGRICAERQANGDAGQR